MSVKYTKIKLGSEVTYYIEERWEDIMNDPEHFELDWDEYDFFYINKIKFDDEHVSIPFSVDNRKCNQFIEEQFNWIIRCCVDLGCIPKRSANTLMRKLDGWKRTGRFLASSQGRKKAIPTKASKATQATLTAIYTNAVNDCLDAAASFIGESYAEELKRNLVIKFSFAPSITRSRGGRKNGSPYLKFGLGSTARKWESGQESYHFNEYRSIANKPDIGSCSGSFEVFCAVLVAHEVAHVIQRNCIKRYPRSKVLYGICTESMKLPHGRGWAEIYRRLRKLTVNQMASYKEGE